MYKVRIVTIGIIFLIPTIGIRTTPIKIPAPYPDIPAMIEPIKVRTMIDTKPKVSNELKNSFKIRKISFSIV